MRQECDCWLGLYHDDPLKQQVVNRKLGWQQHEGYHMAPQITANEKEKARSINTSLWQHQRP
jgi:hypothetical protein